MCRAVPPTPFKDANNPTKNGWLHSVDELPTSGNLRRAWVMPTFMRRMSDKKPISPWGLLRDRVMAEMPRSWP